MTGKYWQRWFWAAGLKDQGLQPGPIFEGFNLLHSAMLAGQGVGLAPTSILADDLRSGRLIRLFDTETLRRLESVPTERGAHTIGFDAARNTVYAFLPDTHRAAVYLDQPG